MKRFLFIAICFTVGVAFAQKPKITTSYSGRECYLYSGKEYAKVWAQADPGNVMMRSERIDDKTGELSIIIFRQDSAKGYVLKPQNKTFIALELAQLNLNSLVGLDIEKNRTIRKEFKGIELLKNGYECHHYISYMTTVLNNGEVWDEGCYEYWEYEPLKVTMQSKIACGFDEPIILYNFQQGPQPASLFEIPKDYKGMYLPKGGMMEMWTGKPREENQQMVDSTKQVLQQGIQDIQDKLKKVQDTPNKEQQIIDLLQMIGSSSKKKK
jgi:hypothetical protein